MRTELIVDAIDMAIEQRRPAPGLVHHSDQGTQYTSIDFGRRCRQVGIDLSMGSVGDCFDNAMAESFFASLETELLYQHRFRGHTDARYEIMRYLDWYNYRRRHSALQMQSPINYELDHQVVSVKPGEDHNRRSCLDRMSTCPEATLHEYRARDEPSNWQEPSDTQKA